MCVELIIPLEKIGYYTRPYQGMTSHGINAEILQWLDEKGESQVRSEWSLIHNPKRARIRFKNENTAMLFKLIWG